jgi:cadmium resistance protein CadD (predicted permease)
MSTSTISLPRGTDCDVEFTLTDDASEPLDITAAQIELLVKASVADGDTGAVIAKRTDTDGGITIADGTDEVGVFTVAFNPEDTADLPVRSYWYDVRILLTTGEQYVVPTPPGTFKVVETVVREVLS